MGLKTSGVGHFAIPTAPAAGTSVTSGAANTFTTTPVVLSASAPSNLFITGVHLESAAALAATYIVVQLMSGGSGSEVVIGQYLVPLSTASTVALGYRQIYPPIPVASGTRLTAKTADSVGAKATLVTLECIAQANVVDDGVAVARVTLVDTLTTYTGDTPQTGDSFARLGAPAGASHAADVAAVKVDTAAIKVKTDFLPSATAGAAGGVQIAGTNAATTYATLTSTGAFTVNGVAAVSQTGDSFARLGAPAGASHAADVAAVKVDTAAVKVQTDKLVFTVAGYLDVNAYKWVGGAIPAVNVTGVPLVDMKYTLGTLSAGAAGSVRADAVTGAVGSVTGAVGSVTGNVGGSVASVTARVTANTDQLAGQTVTAAAGVTFPTSVASPTNITAGTITTVTNLTNAPTAGDLTAAMKTSVTTAATAATPTVAAVSGAVGSVTGNVGGNVSGSVGSVVGLTAANLDVAVSSRLATASYTAPDNSDIVAIRAKTDNLPAAPADETLVIAATNAIMSRIGAGGAGLTTLGDARLANLDATVGSRSTYAGGAVASVTGAVGSVTGAVTVGTNNDKSGYALSAAGVQALWDALTSAFTTIGSIGKKLVDNIDAAISSRSTYAGGPVASVTGDVAGSVGSVVNVVDANITSVNSVAVGGAGTAGSPWTPA